MPSVHIHNPIKRYKDISFQVGANHNQTIGIALSLKTTVTDNTDPANPKTETYNVGFDMVSLMTANGYTATADDVVAFTGPAASNQTSNESVYGVAPVEEVAMEDAAMEDAE